MCDDCGSLERQLAEAATDYDLLVQKLKRALRSEQFALNKLSAAQEIDPSNALVKDLLTYWHKSVGRDGRTKLPLDGDRAKRVRWALKHYTPEEIREAIDGLAAFPYVWKGEHSSRRMRFGTSEQRSDDLTACLYSEKTVEAFRRRAHDEPSGVWMLVPEAAVDRLAKRVSACEIAALRWRNIAQDAEDLTFLVLERLERERRPLRLVKGAA